MRVASLMLFGNSNKKRTSFSLARIHKVIRFLVVLVSVRLVFSVYSARQIHCAFKIVPEGEYSMPAPVMLVPNDRDVRDEA